MTDRYNVGRSSGRTVYRVLPDGSEELVGMLDTPELARELVDAVNARRAAEDAECGWFMTQDEVARREAAAHERGRRAGRQEAARAIRERSFADHHPAGTHAGLLAKAARIAEGDEESGYSPVRAPDSPGGDQQP